MSQTFENLLNTYRRQDGSRWTSQQMNGASGGLVLRSYVTNLSKGRIESPGYEKMKAISKAKGFPPEAWFEDALGELPEGQSDDGHGIAGRVEHPFGAIKNLQTGEPYTNVEVARMTLGDLSEEDLEGIRNGAIGNPTMGQVVALAHAFGVKPSYMLDRGEPVLDAELVEALRDGPGNGTRVLTPARTGKADFRDESFQAARAVLAGSSSPFGPGEIKYHVSLSSTTTCSPDRF